MFTEDYRIYTEIFGHRVLLQGKDFEKKQNISTMFFQIELPRDSMIVGRNRGHVTSRAKRVKYKAEVEAILSLSRGVIHLKEYS